MLHTGVSLHKGHWHLNCQELSGTFPSEVVFVLGEQVDPCKAYNASSTVNVQEML